MDYKPITTRRVFAYALSPVEWRMHVRNDRQP